MTEIPAHRVVEILRLPGLAEAADYLHWDSLRRRSAPAGLDAREWWLALKLQRRQVARPLPLRDTAGTPFSYVLSDAILERLPLVDSHTAGRIGIGTDMLNSEHRDRYVVSSLIEEAITSSQLEGAATTRQDAVAMLRAGRAPQDRSERMILNNYRAMQRITEISAEPMSSELICELHRTVTEGTLHDPEAAGRLQRPQDQRVDVVDPGNGEILHRPPPAAELPDRMRALCDFANGRTPTPHYLHPIVRAIVLHFWLAYDHPFADGNGRTARALFYWSALNSGYWLFEFLSISSLLRKAPVRYARSFLYTETDDGDLSYFILHQLELILRAVEELGAYVTRKTAELQRVSLGLNSQQMLNHRQRALLAHALKHPAQVYTIQSHRHSHQVAYATARADLLQLRALGFLEQFQVAKELRFRAPPNLDTRLQQVGGGDRE